jgi:penicillin-binding protein 1A
LTPELKAVRADAPKPGNKEQPPKKKGGGSGLISRLFWMAVSLGALGLIGGFGVLVAVLFYFSHDLPDYRALEKYEPPIVTRAYASDGRLLAEFAAEKRVFIPVESVPDRVIDAFLSAEDKNFYSHPGIDPIGIARAALANLSGDKLQGASTITQQVAKNFLLTNERSYTRKIREAILSFRIEKALTKDKILELYLNEIFMGARAYGVAAASLEYFNKPLDELTIEEAAFLAALPKAPNNYNPEKYYDAALARRNNIINLMHDNNHITQEEADKAKATPIKTVKRDGDQYVNYPYFAEEVRRKLLELYGEKGLWEGGLIAHTTMIPDYQKTAERALRNGLIAYDQRFGLHSEALATIDLKDWQAALAKVKVPAGAGALDMAVILDSNDKQAAIGLRDGSKAVITYNKMKWASTKGVTPAKVSTLLKPGAVWLVEKTDEKSGKDDVYWLRQIPKVSGGLIAMDPHTGRIFAIAGGFSYEMSQFNRASQAVRQPGSSFKPFVYLAGLQAGFTPATLILDAPFVMDQGPGLAKWRPQNYHEDYNGPTTMRVGIEKSLNLMTIRLANYAGMDKIAEICREFGVNDNLPTMLSMAIGAGDTTLLRMVSAYSVFVNGGKRITPTLMDRVQDRAGKTVYTHDTRDCPECGPMTPWSAQKTPLVPDARAQIADPRYMYQIVSMLEGAVQRGTGTGIRDIGRPVAGKTGTTNDAKDVWFIGFTPDIIVGVYMGFDDPRSLGKKETGGRNALPIVREFMETALKGQPPVPFRVPAGIRLVQVNPQTGTRSNPEDEKSILEAFIAGTEPGDEAMMFTGQGVSTVSDMTTVGESAETGLGGLY